MTLPEFLCHYGSMIRKGLLVVLWFPLTLSLLVLNLTLLAATARDAKQASLNKSNLVFATNHLTAQAGTAQVLGTSVVAGDARSLLLEKFLQRNNSPMAPYADFIVKESDTNGLDFRLLVAIAMCESNLGKHMPAHDSFNPFGIAVYTGQQTGKKFGNWEHAISWVSEYIKTQYYDKGITDLKDIGAVWAPPSISSDYSWTRCVQGFKDSIL